MRFLVIQPFKAFGIFVAQYCAADEAGEFMHPCPVRSDKCATDAEKIIDEQCRKLTPLALYNRYANKKEFKRIDDFWIQADKTHRAYVKEQTDRILLKIIQTAAAADIPIFYRGDKDGTVAESEQLRLSAIHPEPVMKFVRGEENTIYRLLVRTEAPEPIEPQSHGLLVLGLRPGIIILNRTIYFLADDTSGKLFLPFAQKTQIVIKRSLENEYFHKFVLKNVSRAEIHAEGFDIHDDKQAPTGCLSTEQAVNGQWIVSLSFFYGDNEYKLDDRRKGRVSLRDVDGNYTFMRQLRDVSEEQMLHEKFVQIVHETSAPLSNEKGIIVFRSVNNMIGWLRRVSPRLREAGFRVEQLLNKTYYLGNASIDEESKEVGDWFLLRVRITLDDGLSIPIGALSDTILSGRTEYQLPTGELLIIPQEWVERYGPLFLVAHKEDDDKLHIHRSQLAVIPPNIKLEYVDTDNTLPTQLRADLRPYQQEGFIWMWQHICAGNGCCLSDEMGLGKTIQTIAVVLKYKQSAQRSASIGVPVAGMLFSEEEMMGTAEQSQAESAMPYHVSLVVAPSSVVYNWVREIRRFAPSLRVADYTGSPTERISMQQHLKYMDVVVTSYGTLTRDVDFFGSLEIGLLITDECQMIKNSLSQNYQNVASLQAVGHIALSGTPVEDNLMELWSLMHLLCPSLLGSRRDFKSSFSLSGSANVDTMRAQTLRRLVAPFFLKRTKDEVLTQLPPRQDETIWCTMTPEQESRYAAALSKARNEVLAGGNMPLLNAIHQLRFIASGEGKMEEVFSRLEDLRGTQHSVLIFSEYVQMLNRVATEMEHRDWQYEMLTGGTRNRSEIIDRFQNGSAQFFLISLKAGGTGLNITRADYVFILDPWWNRAPEEQAIGRAHRIGQQRPVMVYRFITLNTLEAQILQLQERKQLVIDSVLPFAREIIEKG